jgi:hypothetical protein
MRAAVTKLGSALALGSAEEFGRFVKVQGAKWRGVAEKAGIKID